MRVRKITTSAYHPSGYGGVRRVNHIMAQMLSRLGTNVRTTGTYICRTSSSPTTMPSARPQVLHPTRSLPCFPMTACDNIYARGHQSHARDQQEYVNLAADRQQHSYALVREQDATNASKRDKDNATVFDVLH